MARRRPPTVHGVAVVDKPAGMTSHDVVGLLRRRLGERRIGHAGTLDPDATGVLVVAVGSATRLVRFIGDSTKRYVGQVVLGSETDTLDSAGRVTVVHDMGPVSLDEVRRVVAEHLTGPILQVPPMVSALKQDGRRLHELAREGIEVEREPRPVTIHEFLVHGEPEPGVLDVEVACSSGTYVRTLAADLGHLLGGGAHLRHLRRTAVGSFTIDEAGSPDECELLPVDAAVRSMARVDLDDETARLVADGRVLDRRGDVGSADGGTSGDGRFAGTGPWAVFGPSGTLLAVYEAVGTTRVKPSVVLPSAFDR